MLLVEDCSPHACKLHLATIRGKGVQANEAVDKVGRVADRKFSAHGANMQPVLPWPVSSTELDPLDVGQDAGNGFEPSAIIAATDGFSTDAFAAMHTQSPAIAVVRPQWRHSTQSSS